MGNILETRFFYAGTFAEGPDWHCGPDVHPFDEMICIVRGTIRAELNGVEVVGRAGEALLYPAGVAHEEWALDGKPVESLPVNFFWSGFPEPRPYCVADRHGRLRMLAQWLAAENSSLSSDAAMMRECMVSTLAAEFIRLARGAGSEIVETTRSYIREHIREKFGLEELARNCHLSKFHFAHLYRQASGLAPMADARRIRLEAARELLFTTNLPLKAIAERIGLSNEQHLSHELIRAFGSGARGFRLRSPGGKVGG